MKKWGAKNTVRGNICSAIGTNFVHLEYISDIGKSGQKSAHCKCTISLVCNSNNVSRHGLPKGKTSSNHRQDELTQSKETRELNHGLQMECAQAPRTSLMGHATPFPFRGLAGNRAASAGLVAALVTRGLTVMSDMRSGATSSMLTVEEPAAVPRPGRRGCSGCPPSFPRLGTGRLCPWRLLLHHTSRSNADQDLADR